MHLQVQVSPINPESEYFVRDTRDINRLLKQLSHDAGPLMSAELRNIARDSTVFVARDPIQENAIVGTATLVVIRKLTGVIGQVECVVVDDRYRRHRAGTELMKAVIAAAKAEGVKRIQFTSGNRRVEAHEFYRSLGFVEYDTTVFRMPLK